MAKEKKAMTKKESDDKMNELKVGLLNQKGKRKDIKRAIARLLTAAKAEEKIK